MKQAQLPRPQLATYSDKLALQQAFLHPEEHQMPQEVWDTALEMVARYCPFFASAHAGESERIRRILVDEVGREIEASVRY